MSSPAPYVRRLSDSETHKVVSGEMLGELENGKILENPQLWADTFRGSVSQSLMGSVGNLKYSWPACGCGVKMRIRAIPR